MFAFLDIKDKIFVYYRELIAVIASAGTVAILIISIPIVVFTCKRKFLDQIYSYAD